MALLGGGGAFFFLLGKEIMGLPMSSSSSGSSNMCRLGLKII